jgi:hypothetical protein
MTPQSTLDVYARVGGVWYTDQPDAAGSEDFYTQARAGLNWTRRFNERLRFSTRNFIAYELEPDYAYGFATSRQNSEYLYWQTDNALGYRWTERFATYTGVFLSGLDYDSSVPNSDRFTWAVYNQFRYQISPQTVGTLDYRYSSTDGDGVAEDSTSNFLLIGAEHRFSASTILIARAGAQWKETDGLLSDNVTTPFVEAALRTQINEQFSLRGFVRYGSEVYDTVRFLNGANYDFSNRETLRIGLTSEYAISSRFGLFGGIDYIPAQFDDGHVTGPVPIGTPLTASGLEENLFNIYVGVSVKLTENLTGTLSYNYTDSDSDFANYYYSRDRVSLGLRAEF